MSSSASGGERECDDGVGLEGDDEDPSAWGRVRGMGIGCDGDDDRDFGGERRAIASNLGGRAGAPDPRISGRGVGCTPGRSISLADESLSSVVLLLSVTRRLFLAIWRIHSNGNSPTRWRTRLGSLSGMPSPCAPFASLLPSSMFCRMVSKKGLNATCKYGQHCTRYITLSSRTCRPGTEKLVLRLYAPECVY